MSRILALLFIILLDHCSMAQVIDLSVHGFRSDVTVPIGDMTKRSLEYAFLFNSQAVSMDLSALVVNQGPDTATNVVVIMQAMFGGNDLGAFFSDTLPQLVPGASDTLVIEAELDASGSDAHLSLNFAISSDALDTILTNNYDTVGITIGDYFYSRTDGVWTDTIGLTGVATAFGVRYEVQAEAEACGITCIVPLGPEPVDGILQGVLYDENLIELVSTSDVSIGPWIMSGPGEVGWVFMEFGDLFTLFPGHDYYAVVNVFLNEPPWGFAAAGGCPDSSAFLLDLDTEVLTWLDRTPVIGLAGMGCQFGISEHYVSDPVLQPCFPDPSSGMTSFPYSTTDPGSARFEIRNSLGVLVETRALPGRTAGTDVLEVDLSGLPAGVYSYSIISDDTRATRMMVVGR